MFVKDKVKNNCIINNLRYKKPVVNYNKHPSPQISRFEIIGGPLFHKNDCNSILKILNSQKSKLYQASKETKQGFEFDAENFLIIFVQR